MQPEIHLNYLAILAAMAAFDVEGGPGRPERGLLLHRPAGSGYDPGFLAMRMEKVLRP